MVTSRCFKCAVIPSKLSAQNEQFLRPSFQSVPLHEMIYQQLAAALEQLRKSLTAIRAVEYVRSAVVTKLLPQMGRPGLVIVSSSGDISSMGPVTGRGEPSAWRDLVRTCSARFSHFDLFRSLLLRWTLKPSNAVYPDLSWALSIGSFRTRLPVAAKIALVTAGITADVPGSPTPPGASALLTRWTSIKGASLMRSIR